MRVIAWPAFKREELNPYTALLYRNMRDIGIDVVELEPSRVMDRTASILHIHWPDVYFSLPGYWSAWTYSTAVLALLRIARVNRIRVVWTVHHLHSHDGRYARMERRFWPRFLRCVDGLIHLSETGRRLFLELWPSMRPIPSAIIPHGHYRGVYPNVLTRGEARARLGLKPDHRVLTYVGQLRPYKNVPSLISAFRELRDPDARLISAGMPLTAGLARAFADVAAGDSRVLSVLGHIRTENMQLYINAADCVVLPDRTILNSGAALLALSFNRPVVVPESGALGELRESIGEDWVRTYGGDLDGRLLGECLQWAISSRRAPVPVLDRHDWGAIAQATGDFFQALTARSGHAG